MNKSSASMASVLVALAVSSIGCQAPEGDDVRVVRSALGVAPAAPTVSGGPDSCTLSVRLFWTAPSGVPSSQIKGWTLFRDGHPITPGDYTTIGAYDNYALLPATAYSYQVAWRDQTGANSDLSPPLVVTMPPRCTRPEYADGKITFAAVLLKLSDAPAVPFSADQARTWLFSDPHGIASYIGEVSRGSLAVQGDVYGWFTLTDRIQDRCGTIDSTSHLGYNCSFTNDDLTAIATANGVPVANYERIAFYVDGSGVAGFTSGNYCVMGASLAGQSTGPGVLAHECFGHGFGLNHAGDWECPADVGPPVRKPGPSFLDPTQGGCQSSRYADGYDPMGVASHDYSTQNLYLLGLLGDAERTVAQPGGVYWLGKLSSSVHPLKELMVPVYGHAFYFAEYRAPEGFNGLARCTTCAPELDGGDAENGVTVRLWRDAPVQYPTGGFDDVNTWNVTQTPVRPGQRFEDPYRGIRIIPLAEDADGSQVRVALCGNHVKDGDETDVDCGGSCGPCADGKVCLAGQDCANQVCTGGVCTHSCSDGVQNGDEIYVDCGGSCPLCPDGTPCTDPSICQGHRCGDDMCLSDAACFDGYQESDEVGTDCGHVCALKCPLYTRCYRNDDCASYACLLGRCLNACADGRMDGDESDSDCGGRGCAACADGRACRAGTDCTSGVCRRGLCAPATCANGEWDDGEVLADCGGVCGGCPDGAYWCHSNADCNSYACLLGRCMNACADGRMDGGETDIDCGGPGYCARCAATKACVAGSDCVSGTCTTGHCN
jgi:hypothetical protein